MTSYHSFIRRTTLTIVTINITFTVVTQKFSNENFSINFLIIRVIQVTFLYYIQCLIVLYKSIQNS